MTENDQDDLVTVRISVKDSSFIPQHIYQQLIAIKPPLPLHEGNPREKYLLFTVRKNDYASISVRLKESNIHTIQYTGSQIGDQNDYLLDLTDSKNHIRLVLLRSITTGEVELLIWFRDLDTGREMHRKMQEMIEKFFLDETGIEAKLFCIASVEDNLDESWPGYYVFSTPRLLKLEDIKKLLSRFPMDSFF
ncbi:MAG: hypothetical protein ACFFD4_27080 [Candidatus Odinarchaeota archaeon]